MSEYPFQCEVTYCVRCDKRRMCAFVGHGNNGDQWLCSPCLQVAKDHIDAFKSSIMEALQDD